ncbi:PAS domain S-box protein [Pontibacter harenae]|uniref:PAS domain S-box protein n=1 Tax=Pontibacter harenae TaxID=2894083 RepID=UPI001E571ADD|nr:PAS domain S-box protein [Pontibacter harenae]MCC9169019.1 PAS domain S-box protein [Pontibacter harenae]
MEEKGNRIMLHHVLRYSPDMICVIAEGGRFMQVSHACSQMLGYTEEELEGLSAIDLVPPRDRALAQESLRSAREGNTETQFENSVIGKHGQQVPLHWTVVWLEEEGYFFCVARDISARWRVEKEMRRKEAVQRVLVDHGSDMQALLDENGNYLYVAVAESYEKAFGYRADQIMGRSSLSLVHPDDMGRAEQAFARLHQTQELIQVSDVRFRASSGEWRWVETRASNQLANSDVQAIVVSSRDITDRKQDQLKLQESQQRYRSLFDNNPSMVLFQDEAGTILDANPAFLSFMARRREEVLNRPLSDFLPSEAVPLFRQKLKEAFSGSDVSFEAEVIFREQGHRVLSVVKVPLSVAGRIVGVHAVIRDITEETQAHKTVERQAKRLSTIFESITDAFCTLDRNWNFTYTNPAFDNVMHVDSSGFIGKFAWDVYPEEENGVFHREYRRAVETGESARFQAHLERLDKWLEVRAFPSEEGLSVYFSDITGRVQQRQELEKLSLVASKTSNSVVILDAQRQAEWVNEGFTRMTGYTLEEVIGKNPRDLLIGPDTDKAELQRISEKFAEGVSFNTNLVNYRKSGERFWLAMDVSPVFGTAGCITHFVAIQKDITFRKEAEANLVKMSQALYQQNKDLEQFTYIVSHNLRAPVANVLGLSDLLTRIDKGSSLFEKTLSNLNLSAHRLDTVLGDLNTILTVRDSKGNLEREEVNVRLKAQQALASLQELLEGCGGTVTVDIDEDLSLRANKAYLYSVFHNLLSNAIKYRSRERNLQVQIKCESDSEQGVTVSFADNGSGFDMERARDKVFRLYSRFHPEIEGKGIGLYLVKAHLEAMGGGIEVASEVGAGTRFLIYLPKA